MAAKSECHEEGVREGEDGLSTADSVLPARVSRLGFGVRPHFSCQRSRVGPQCACQRSSVRLHFVCQHSRVRPRGGAFFYERGTPVAVRVEAVSGRVLGLGRRP